MTDLEKPFALVEVVGSAVIKKDAKYLLVQEKQPKAFGLWSFPSGHVNEGETLEQATVREAKEECGIDIELHEELLVLHPSMQIPVLHAFRATIISGEVVFRKDEFLDAGWFTLDEIRAMKDKLRNTPYIVGAIERAEQIKTGDRHAYS